MTCGHNFHMLLKQDLIYKLFNYSDYLLMSFACRYVVVVVFTV